MASVGKMLHRQASPNGLSMHLDAISNLFAVDKDWLLRGGIDDLTYIQPRLNFPLNNAFKRPKYLKDSGQPQYSGV